MRIASWAGVTTADGGHNGSTRLEELKETSILGMRKNPLVIGHNTVVAMRT